MPAQFSIREADLRTVLRELRQLDPNLRKQLQRDMKTGLQPVVDKLAATVPKQSPLSGFATASSRGTRYNWGAVRGSTVTPLGKRAKKPGFVPVVSMRFRSRGKTNAGFEIMELAGSKTQGQTPQGRAMISALNSRFPVRQGLGRFVIPEAKGEADAALRIAKGIVERYVALVNRRIRS
jgi:hypothetical protein